MRVQPRLVAPSPVIALLALLALAAAACGPTTPALTDPAEILQKAAASLGETRSFHVRGVIDGEVPLSIGGAGGGAPLPLDGTTLDGDVDVANGELAVEILAPALLNLRANLVVADGSAYLRAPIITGGSWVRQPAERRDRRRPAGRPRRAGCVPGPARARAGEARRRALHGH